MCVLSWECRETSCSVVASCGGRKRSSSSPVLLVSWSLAKVVGETSAKTRPLVSLFLGHDRRELPESHLTSSQLQLLSPKFTSFKPHPSSQIPKTPQFPRRFVVFPRPQACPASHSVPAPHRQYTAYILPPPPCIPTSLHPRFPHISPLMAVACLHVPYSQVDHNYKCRRTNESDIEGADGFEECLDAVVVLLVELDWGGEVLVGSWRWTLIYTCFVTSQLYSNPI